MNEWEVRPGGQTWEFAGSVNQDAMVAEGVSLTITFDSEWQLASLLVGPDNLAAATTLTVSLRDAGDRIVMRIIGSAAGEQGAVVDNITIQPFATALKAAADIEGVQPWGFQMFPDTWDLAFAMGSLAQNEDMTVRVVARIFGGNEPTVAVGTNDTLTTTVARTY